MVGTATMVAARSALTAIGWTTRWVVWLGMGLAKFEDRKTSVDLGEGAGGCDRIHGVDISEGAEARDSFCYLYWRESEPQKMNRGSGHDEAVSHRDMKSFDELDGKGLVFYGSTLSVDVPFR